MVLNSLTIQEKDRYAGVLTVSPTNTSGRGACAAMACASGGYSAISGLCTSK